jgi:uncharacterized protein YbjT (DUF2867 family)
MRKYVHTVMNVMSGASQYARPVSSVPEALAAAISGTARNDGTIAALSGQPFSGSELVRAMGTAITHERPALSPPSRRPLATRVRGMEAAQGWLT